MKHIGLSCQLFQRASEASEAEVIEVLPGSNIQKENQKCAKLETTNLKTGVTPDPNWGLGCPGVLSPWFQKNKILKKSIRNQEYFSLKITLRFHQENHRKKVEFQSWSQKGVLYLILKEISRGFQNWSSFSPTTKIEGVTGV